MVKVACVFDHLQKTAGTAWTKYIAEAFPGRNVSPRILHEDIRFAAKLTATYDIVSGHLDLSPEYDWPTDIYHMTLLREPIDRFLSHFHYVRSLERAWEPFGQLAKSHTLDGAVAMRHPDVERYIQHFYVRHFLKGMHPSSVVDQLLAEERFSVEEIARFVLARYDLVGVTEQIGLAADCFGFHMGGAIGVEMPVVRRTEARPRLEEIAPATLAMLTRLSASDRSLYDALSAGFFRGVRRVITSATEGGRGWRHRPLDPEIKELEEGQGGCALEGVDVFCPVAPTNDRVTCGERCTLSAIFRFKKPAAEIMVHLTIRNQILQVAYRDTAEARFAEEVRVELTWDFVCSLGEGTYDCSFDVVLDETESGELVRGFRNAYQFEVLAPAGRRAAGLTWLGPRFRVSAASDGAGVLKGKIKIPQRNFVARPGEFVRIPITVHNSGDESWRVSGFNRVVAAVSLMPAGVPSEFSSAVRQALTHDVQAGEQLAFELVVTAPWESGCYVVWMGLVQERISWFCFDERGVILQVKFL